MNSYRSSARDNGHYEIFETTNDYLIYPCRYRFDDFFSTGNPWKYSYWELFQNRNQFASFYRWDGTKPFDYQGSWKKFYYSMIFTGICDSGNRVWVILYFRIRYSYFCIHRNLIRIQFYYCGFEAFIRSRWNRKYFW